MSKFSRVTIGTTLILCAVGFVAVAPLLGADSPKGALPFYGMAGFCVIAAMACFTPRGRVVTLRIVGATIAAAYGWYVVQSIGGDDFGRAVRGAIVIGLPAAFVAVTGGYPKWGRAAAAFRSDMRETVHRNDRSDC